MPRKFFKRYMPRPERLLKEKSLGFLSKQLADPGLWTLTRRSVAGAFSIGLFFAFMPMPFQMIPAALLATFFRVNLPIAVGLVWVSNPLTMPPMLYASYLFGSWLLDLPAHAPTDNMWEWIHERFSHIWQPLLLGSVIFGGLAALISHLAVRLIWRWHVANSWSKRRNLKRLPSPETFALTHPELEPNPRSQAKPSASTEATPAAKAEQDPPAAG
ncbi:DUF2062 domain-containing protein [Marinospirillum sp. MEB164]|uniref:DUF2062 domain-containing protein n=1 Tax=Marinospirillum alkalitolerans TaxID=3123374 RepID=A0ABW8PUK6_9GAMM